VSTSWCRAHSGTYDQILLPVGKVLSESCGLVSVGRPLWREDGSAICSVITQWSESRKTRNRTLLSHLRHPQSGGPGPRIYIPQEQGGPVIPPGTLLLRIQDRRVRVTLRPTVSQSVSTSWCRAHFMDVWPDIASSSRGWVWNWFSFLFIIYRRGPRRKHRLLLFLFLSIALFPSVSFLFFSCSLLSTALVYTNLSGVVLLLVYCSVPSTWWMSENEDLALIIQFVH
jgi:hypothetical protein